MLKLTEKTAWSLSRWVFMAGMIAMILTCTVQCNSIHWSVEHSEKVILAFWPPDIVPHPILPEPKPEDDLA